MSTQASVAKRSWIRAAAVALAAGAIFSLGAVFTSPPAHAAARVEVSPAPNADGATTVTLSGSGFQYVPNAPGGIYIFFGAVSDPSTNAWAPSQGGRSGSTFGYAGASGSILLAAFEGGSSAPESNAVIGADGTWTAQMTIPGSSFASSSGNPHAGQAVEGAVIDCLQVQCGIITIGAHGAVNANNESFTPVGFVTADGSIQSGTATQSFTDDATVLDLGSSSNEAAPDEAQEDQPAAAVVAEDPADPLASSGSTTVVLFVLGGAVLALLGAVTTVMVKRAKARRNLTPSVEGDTTETQTTPPTAEPEPEVTSDETNQSEEMSKL